jgi:protease I
MKDRSSAGKGVNWALLILLLTLVSVVSTGEEKQAQTEQAQTEQAQTKQVPTKQAPTRQARRGAPATRLKTIQLPQPATSSAVSVEQAMIEQHKTQAPGNQRLDLAQIGQLAWATQAAGTPSLVTVPTPAPISSEPLIRAYFIIPEGVFAYEPAGHLMQQISDGDVRAAMAAALSNQPSAPAGGCQVILAASTKDFTARYGARGRTVSALLAGRASQSIQLQAVALGLTFVSIDAVEGTDVRRVARIPRNYEALYAIFVGYPAGQAPADTTPQAAVPQSGRSALLIIAPRGFQDEELFATRRALELAGVQVTVASTRMGVLTGMLGRTTQANMLLNQANVDNFDALVFIGGIGAIDYINNPTAQNLARQAAAKQKVLAAIGTAPSILAGAGVLQGVTATAYLAEQQRLIRGGALYTGNAAEKQGLIITAVGSPAAALFAQAILEGLGEVKR